MLRLGWGTGFADDRERVACLRCCEVGAPLHAAARHDSNFELLRVLRQYQVAAIDDVVCDDAESASILGAARPLSEVQQNEGLFCWFAGHCHVVER